jgi:hypothetical protein
MVKRFGYDAKPALIDYKDLTDHSILPCSAVSETKSACQGRMPLLLCVESKVRGRQGGRALTLSSLVQHIMRQNPWQEECQIDR